MMPKVHQHHAPRLTAHRNNEKKCFWQQKNAFLWLTTNTVKATMARVWLNVYSQADDYEYATEAWMELLMESGHSSRYSEKWRLVCRLFSVIGKTYSLYEGAFPWRAMFTGLESRLLLANAQVQKNQMYKMKISLKKSVQNENTLHHNIPD